MEEKNNALEGFLNILKEQHENISEKINNTLYDDICRTAEIVDKTENEAESTGIIENLRDRFKKVDLNQVTDLFIYNQMFFTNNENPLPTASILCINIGKLFTQENLHYIAAKVYSSDEIEGGSALSFLGYLALQEHHRNYILTFIKNNFDGFSQNKKTECVFQLKQYLPDDELANKIVNDSGITVYELTFSTEVDATSKPVTFKFDTVGDVINKKSSGELYSPKKDSFVKNVKSVVKEEKLDSKPSWWQFWKNNN